MAAERNPNAPKDLDVLTLDDVVEDLRVVTHFSGVAVPYQEVFTIKVLHTGNSRPWADIAYSTGRETSVHLAALGICPSSAGIWSKNYTVRAQ